MEFDAHFISLSEFDTVHANYFILGVSHFLSPISLFSLFLLFTWHTLVHISSLYLSSPANKRNKRNREKREIGEKGWETAKIKQFACTVINCEKLTNSVSNSVRSAGWVLNSEISGSRHPIVVFELGDGKSQKQPPSRITFIRASIIVGCELAKYWGGGEMIGKKKEVDCKLTACLWMGWETSGHVLIVKSSTTIWIQKILIASTSCIISLSLSVCVLARGSK